MSQLYYPETLSENLIQIPEYKIESRYRIRYTKVSMNRCFADLGRDTLSGRRFINNTDLSEVYVLDGSTGKKVQCISTINPLISINEQRFIISVTTIPNGGFMSYDKAPKNMAGDPINEIYIDAVEYGISREDLVKGPVYIPPLNVTITYGHWVYDTPIPDISDIINNIRIKLQTWANELMNYPPFLPYVELPQDYHGPKRFFLGINNTVCVLPVLDTDNYTLEQPLLYLKYRDYHNTKLLIEKTIPLTKENLLRPYTTLTLEDQEWIFGTNYYAVSDYIQKNTADTDSTKSTIRTLKNENQKLRQDLEDMSREHKRLLDNRKQEYDEFQQERKEFRDEKKEFYQQRDITNRWWTEILKGSIGIIVVGFLKYLISLAVKTGGTTKK